MKNDSFKYYIPGFEERLKSYFGVKKSLDLARLFDENYNTFNHYLTGRNRVPVDLLIKIYNSSKNIEGGPLNLAWLLTGEGPMCITETEGYERLTGQRKKIVQDFLISQLLKLGVYENENAEMLLDEIPKKLKKA